jgi:hypothetical protein
MSKSFHIPFLPNLPGDRLPAPSGGRRSRARWSRTKTAGANASSVSVSPKPRRPTIPAIVLLGYGLTKTDVPAVAFIWPGVSHPLRLLDHIGGNFGDPPDDDLAKLKDDILSSVDLVGAILRRLRAVASSPPAGRVRAAVEDDRRLGLLVSPSASSISENTRRFTRRTT